MTFITKNTMNNFQFFVNILKHLVLASKLAKQGVLMIDTCELEVVDKNLCRHDSTKKKPMLHVATYQYKYNLPG